MDRSTEEALGACVAFFIFWTLAYLTWTKKIGKMGDSFARGVYKMSEDQIDAMNKMGAIFVALIGTIPITLIMIPVGPVRQTVVVLFLLGLVASPGIFYRANPPKATADEPKTAKGFFSKNRHRVISLIAFASAIAVPLSIYFDGPTSLFFAVASFLMCLFVAVMWFFVSLY